jgi:DNA-binding XRE family transcriptional regulator
MPFKIREFRKKLLMSQEELATKAGVSRQTISGLENGSIKVTTTDTLVKISNALGARISDIFLP